MKQEENPAVAKAEWKYITCNITKEAYHRGKRDTEKDFLTLIDTQLLVKCGQRMEVKTSRQLFKARGTKKKDWVVKLTYDLGLREILKINMAICVNSQKKKL